MVCLLENVLPGFYSTSLDGVRTEVSLVEPAYHTACSNRSTSTVVLTVKHCSTSTVSSAHPLLCISKRVGINLGALCCSSSSGERRGIVNANAASALRGHPGTDQLSSPRFACVNGCVRMADGCFHNQGWYIAHTHPHVRTKHGVIQIMQP
eukprot:890325-Amphidinium_carterae.1